MNKPFVLAAIALATLLTGLPGCASKPGVSAPQAGRFRIVSISDTDAQVKMTALLDTETGCMWEYMAPSMTALSMPDFGVALAVGSYPDVDAAEEKMKVPMDDKTSTELNSLALKNVDEQEEDCDAVRYRAVQDALGKKPSR